MPPKKQKIDLPMLGKDDLTLSLPDYVALMNNWLNYYELMDIINLDQGGAAVWDWNTDGTPDQIEKHNFVLLQLKTSLKNKPEFLKPYLGYKSAGNLWRAVVQVCSSILDKHSICVVWLLPYILCCTNAVHIVLWVHMYCILVNM